MILLHLITTIFISCTTFLLSDIVGSMLTIFGSTVASTSPLFNAGFGLNIFQALDAPAVAITDLIVSPAYPISTVNPGQTIQIPELTIQAIHGPLSPTELYLDLPLAEGATSQKHYVGSFILTCLLNFVVGFFWSVRKVIRVLARGPRRICSVFTGIRFVHVLDKVNPVPFVILLVLAVVESHLWSQYPKLYTLIKIGDDDLYDVRQWVAEFILQRIISFAKHFDIPYLYALANGHEKDGATGWRLGGKYPQAPPFALKPLHPQDPEFFVSPFSDQNKEAKGEEEYEETFEDARETMDEPNVSGSAILLRAYSSGRLRLRKRVTRAPMQRKCAEAPPFSSMVDGPVANPVAMTNDSSPSSPGRSLTPPLDDTSGELDALSDELDAFINSIRNPKIKVTPPLDDPHLEEVKASNRTLSNDFDRRFMVPRIPRCYLSPPAPKDEWESWEENQYQQEGESEWISDKREGRESHVSGPPTNKSAEKCSHRRSKSLDQPASSSSREGKSHRRTHSLPDSLPSTLRDFYANLKPVKATPVAPTSPSMAKVRANVDSDTRKKSARLRVAEEICLSELETIREDPEETDDTQELSLESAAIDAQQKISSVVSPQLNLVNEPLKPEVLARIFDTYSIPNTIRGMSAWLLMQDASKSDEASAPAAPEKRKRSP